jgi:hypothetical protein
VIGIDGYKFLLRCLYVGESEILPEAENLKKDYEADHDGYDHYPFYDFPI